MSTSDKIRELSVPTVQDLLSMEFPDQPDVVAKLAEFGLDPTDFTLVYYEGFSPMVVYKKGTKDERRVTNYQKVIPKKPYTFCNSWTHYLSTLS
ncbi:hypothetical protein M0P48_02795 [Candidatus Gracilibacteria bacterium]|jgi:hypothetical protein|nr:hypothetical protein [Candidatus Gracilibacteria bacterium]